MHPDLDKLLALQSKDSELADLDARQVALDAAVAALDAELRRARDERDAAQRVADDAARRRDEQEQKIETLRQAQERRKQMVEYVRTPKEGATLMADMDLARQVLAKEEGDWLRAADAVAAFETKAAEQTRLCQEFEASQAPGRKEIDGHRRELEGDRAARLDEREAAASQLERTLRMRYDRLRRARAASVVVPLNGGACGACFTAVPKNRRSQIKAGMLLEGCEACGVILYSADR